MIQSTPSGADVRVSNGFTGRTPFTFTAPRKGDLIVTVSHPGYEPQEHILHSSVVGKGAAGVAGNALIGGVIGIGVDMATGAALSHKPNPLSVTLKPVDLIPRDKPPPPPAESAVVVPEAPLPPTSRTDEPQVAVKSEPAGDKPETATGSTGAVAGGTGSTQ